MKNKEVHGIIKSYLEKNGYTGLVSGDFECGCEISDLAPCDGPIMSCQAGYKVNCNSECEHTEGGDWHIQLGKPKDPKKMESWQTANNYFGARDLFFRGYSEVLCVCKESSLVVSSEDQAEAFFRECTKKYGTSFNHPDGSFLYSCSSEYCRCSQ